VTGQSRTHSAIEAVANTAIGFVISMIVGEIAFPLCGVAVSLHQNFALTCIFTVSSLARSYVLRRAFNGRRLPRPPLQVKR
jgi:hypothetical protein